MKGTLLLLNLLLFSLTLQNHLVNTQSSNYTTFTPIARYLNVSVSEVPQLLAQEKILIEGNRKLTPLLTQNEKIFGGSFIDVIANKININTKDLSKDGIITSNSAMKPYLDLLSFKQVNNSLYDLNSTFEDLKIWLKETMQPTLSDAIKLNPIIIYEEPEIEVNNYSVEDTQINDLVLGGDGIHTFGFTTRCSAGFWVRSRSNSTPYIMTAGHCSKSGPFNSDGSVNFFHLPWEGIVGRRFIGPMARPDMSVADMGFISKQNSQIGVIPSVRNTDDQEFPELMIYGGDEFNGLIRATHMSCGGDSGAPVFQFAKDILPGIFITGMITGGHEGRDVCVIEPIAKLITDDIYVLTINDNNEL
ncbi:hypothetical protein C2G38_2159968 [Gigaspora rosea]|uniref:Peptidase S1 domain-containing protein n=1 Tax=Gigaspora rosea TaxID=44941 RepID=A0A397W0E4_9GLOM|nr:hypothetical protein C2G38_2159968 [Gigaspora rosea]